MEDVDRERPWVVWVVAAAEVPLSASQRRARWSRTHVGAEAAASGASARARPVARPVARPLAELRLQDIARFGHPNLRPQVYAAGYPVDEAKTVERVEKDWD